MSDDAQTMPGPPKPGPEHERFKPFAGTFRAKVTLFMGPGQSLVTTGTMVNSYQLDGLYLYQDYVGDPSEGPFPAFLGKGFWGYNTTTGRYEGFWIDNASTMMQTEQGDVDDSGKVWTMHSELVHPATGQLTKKRSVITLIDNDHHRMDSFMTGSDGQDVKTMEIEYERVS